MQYTLSDTEWQLILTAYENNQSRFSLVTRNNIANLINTIAASKQITSLQQINLLIALLLSTGNDQQVEDTKTDFPCEKKKERKKEELKSMDSITLLELLRALRFQLQTQSDSKSLHKDHALDRR